MKRPARLLFRLTADIDALDSLYLRILVPAAVALCTALAVSVALGLMHPLLGLAVRVWLLLTGFGIPLIAGRAARKTMRAAAPMPSRRCARGRSISSPGRPIWSWPAGLPPSGNAVWLPIGAWLASRRCAQPHRDRSSQPVSA